MNRRLAGLYVILDMEVARDRDLREIAAAALRGGARVLQLRSKAADKGDILPLAKDLAALAKQANAIFVVNDHADLALVAGADGVHVGQHDLPVEAVRQVVGCRAIIGCSAATPDEARAAERAGASYLGTGAIYPTRSKERTRPTGLDGLRRVVKATALPVFGVGGITAENVGEVIAAGALGAAVIGAVVAAPDVEAAAARLAEAIHRAIERKGTVPSGGIL